MRIGLRAQVQRAGGSGEVPAAADGSDGAVGNF